MIRVVGLDMSVSNCGLAEFTGNLPLTSVYRTPDPAPRLASVKWADTTPATIEDELERIRSLASRCVYWITHTVELGAPADTLFVFEGPSIGSTNGKPDERAGLRWVTALNLRAFGRITFVPPRSVKKYWTDNGNADKKLMLAWAERRYPEMHISDDNIADALALAHMGAEHCGIIPISRPPLVNSSALAGVDWPT